MDGKNNSRSIITRIKSLQTASQIDGLKSNANTQQIISNLTGQVFFNPQQPVRGNFQDSSIRNIDYLPGENIRFQPRIGDGELSFKLLRTLAEYDVAAMCINTRKDQFARLLESWDIVYRATGKPAPDSDVRYIKDFLAKPDGELSFESWTRKSVEEMLVTDALSVLITRDIDGNLVSLELIDGSTIKPFIDAFGRPPKYPSPRYCQVLQGIPANLLTSEDLIYYPRNPRVWKFYGHSPVEQAKNWICLAISRMDELQEFFDTGNMPAALISIEANKDVAERLQAILDSQLSGNIAMKSKAILLGSEAGQQRPSVIMKKDPLTTNELDETMFRLICYAFSINPASFTKTTTKATASVLKTQAEEEGLVPLMYWFQELMSEQIFRKAFGRDDILFQFNIEKEDTDPEIAKAEDIFIKNGTMTNNEVRNRHGLEPVKGGDINWLFTSKGPVKLVDMADDKFMLNGDPQTQPAETKGIGTESGLANVSFKPKEEVMKYDDVEKAIDKLKWKI